MLPQKKSFYSLICTDAFGSYLRQPFLSMRCCTSRLSQFLINASRLFVLVQLPVCNCGQYPIAGRDQRCQSLLTSNAEWEEETSSCHICQSVLFHWPRSPMPCLLRTHEAPVSQDEEASLWVEGDVGAGSLGVVTTSHHAGRREGPAADGLRRACGEHLHAN